MSFTLRFEPSGRTIEAEAGRTILDAAREAGVPVAAVCGGRGTCGKCRVRVLDGPPPPVTKMDEAALPEDSLGQGWRLSCQCVVTEPLVLQSMPVYSRPKAEAQAFAAGFAVDPLVTRRSVEIPRPSLERPSDDMSLLCASLGAVGEGEIRCTDPEIIRELPDRLREFGWKATASLRQGELVGLRPFAASHPPLGCALDLGTTNLALYLHRLDDGELLGVFGAPNPLSSFGADIVSRLGYSEKSPECRRELQTVLVGALNLLAEQAARESGYSTEDIEELVVVGNSGMHHLFLGLPGGQLIRAPYVPALRSSLTIKARDLGIAISRGGYLYLPPLVGGFVGSDLLALALSARMDRREGIRLAVDMGTNTEVLLSVDGELRCCSTASGPALEGAALRFGTVAVPGAIDRAWVGEGGRPEFGTIGEGPATGICGSGIIDALRVLRELGALSRNGRLKPDFEGVLSEPGGDHRYALAPEGGNSLGEALTISQAEIRSVLLAKGAIRAGIDILLASRGIEASEVDEILVAGSFGNHLDIESAVAIGLFPSIGLDRFRQIGNAAGAGAGLILLSGRERRAAEGMSGAIAHVELSLQENFRRRFAEAQWFPEESA
jgi:uncharacterized 2Fe-2S/4Fe-4S cluster protein (DUF4445 family)